MTRKIAVEESSGNVFADIGLPNPGERLAKALLSRAISKAVKARGLTQLQAAAILGTTQPKVSDLMRGNLGSFTIGRLIRYLTALNMDVRIEVTPSASEGQTGQVQVDLA
ncbi:MAG TPA: helix-turn-helix transcriptional regulator [Longimicrobiaceae bacterium]|nr:helix-turn-helix transcriptional regulator [Longimicrobiaceae bacterium]